MIPIVVDNKKHNIKAIWELTTSEFIEMSKIEAMNVQRYIAWQCGLDEQLVFFAKISPAIEAAIGVAPDITKLPMCKRFAHVKQIETIGQRHQIESSGKTNFELLAFTLAVAEARSNNIDDVNKLYSQYMQQPFYEILPTGFFFFSRSRRGSKRGLGVLKKLPELIRMRKLKKQLVPND